MNLVIACQTSLRSRPQVEFPSSPHPFMPSFPASFERTHCPPLPYFETVALLATPSEAAATSLTLGELNRASLTAVLVSLSRVHLKQQPLPSPAVSLTTVIMFVLLLSPRLAFFFHRRE